MADVKGISPFDVGHAGDVVDTHHYHRYAQKCEHRYLQQ
jgi:hypothetical protein